MYRILPASPSELRKVLRLTLAEPGQSATTIEEQVTRFIEYARHMRFDLTRQWWCWRGNQIVGTCTCIESPGRTAMILLPCGSTMPHDPGASDLLLQHVATEGRSRGIRLLQCLVHPGDTTNSKLLADQDFREVAELIYLERDVGSQSAFVPAKPPLPEHHWWTYSSQRHTVFAETILVTYEESMDCSGLAGLRDIDDIIAGHKSAGVFEPQRWRLLLIEKAIAGCILLAVNPLQPHVEIVYVGVCPDFRGRGIGRWLVSEALSQAHREGFQKVTLAVDASNVPALDIYKSLNFAEVARRGAWVRPIAATPIAAKT